MAEKKPAKKPTKDADGPATVVATLAAMPAADRVLGERLHAIITSTAPALTPKLWYGMPAYANSGGKVVCFFQAASKFKTRYATFGFQHDANLDDGGMWPVAFGITEITPTIAERITELVKKAVGS